MSLWKAAYALVGLLGVTGTIALFVFAPGIFSVALKAAVRFVTLVLSYRAGCAVVAGALAAFAADYHRHSKDDAEFARRTAAFEQAQIQRDKDIANRTRLEVAEELARQQLADMDVDKDVKEFTDALPPAPDTGNPFAVGNDYCRLRHLAGQAECGHQGPARSLRTAHPKG